MANLKSDWLIDDKDPISQYVIEGRVSVGSAKSFTTLSSEEKIEPTIIPASTKLKVFSILLKELIKYVSTTAKIPKEKEIIVIL